MFFSIKMKVQQTEFPDGSVVSTSVAGTRNWVTHARPNQGTIRNLHNYLQKAVQIN